MDLLTLICRNNPHAFPENYMLPQNEVPTEIVVGQWEELPVIDYSQPKKNLVDQVIRASRDFGMFQVINHGISSWIMDEAMTASKQFFDLPAEQLYEYANPHDQKFPLYTSSVANLWGMEKDHFYWRDALTIIYNCNMECMNEWPSQPPCFRDNIWNFGARLKIIETGLLSIVSRGLGLGKTYFSNGLADWNTFTINRYPRCPSPSLTCGMPKHCDPNLLTIQLLGEVAGLQIYVNDNWKYVIPRRDALLVTLGRQMKIISNGILKPAEHRVVANDKMDRTTLSYFVHPDRKCIVGPAKELTISNPSRYRSFKYKEYLERHHLHFHRNSDYVESYYMIN